MKYSRKFLTLIFAIVLLTGLTAIAASAQSRGRYIQRPVVVRHYYYVRHNPFYSWYYDPFYYDPYYNERRQRSYLRSRVNGNREELRKHLEKYNADGVITPKEQAELDDDYRDVERAERNLDDFNDDYGD